MGVLVLTVILMRTVLEFAKTPGTTPVLEICSLPMAMSGFTIFSAAFPSWAFANQYYKETKNHYDYFIASRMSWRRYGIMRILSVGISGGLIIAIPLAIVFSYCYLIGSRELGYIFEGMRVRIVIETFGVPAVLCIKVCLGFLFGSFWALVGFLASFLLKNKYAPFLLPFVLSQFFWIIFQNHPALNPNFYPFYIIFIVIAIVSYWRSGRMDYHIMDKDI
ncbi:hypothetical protein NXH76_16075 [Blautia schinkii]|nr:hypothetical protein [Blautia schinkii]